MLTLVAETLEMVEEMEDKVEDLLVEEMEVKGEDLQVDNPDSPQIKRVDLEEVSLSINQAKEMEDLVVQEDHLGPEVKLMEDNNNRHMVLVKEEALEVKIKTKEVNHQEEEEQQEVEVELLQEAEEVKGHLAEAHNQDTLLLDLLDLRDLVLDLDNLIMEEEVAVEIMMKSFLLILVMELLMVKMDLREQETSHC